MVVMIMVVLMVTITLTLMTYLLVTDNAKEEMSKELSIFTK